MNPVFDHAGIHFDRQSRTLTGLTAEAIAALHEAFSEGRVLLLRSFLDRTWADELRAATHDLLSNATLPPDRQSAHGPVPDHARIALLREGQGGTARLRRSWLAFGWNPSPGGLTAVARGLDEVRNAVEGRPAGLEVAGDSVPPAAEVMHSPRGGGFCARHGSEQRAGAALIGLALSQRGRDFNEGGLHVETAAGRVDVDGHLALGDACLFQAALVREVVPIDPARSRAGEPDWHSPGGRWVLRPSLQFVEDGARGSWRAGLEERQSSGLSPPPDSVAPEGDVHAEDVTAEWCALLGIRQAGQRVGPATVDSIHPGEVRFRWPGATAPLGVSCRPARRGPAFCSSSRFAIHYRLNGAQSLTVAQARFLHALCAATRAAEIRSTAR